VTIDPITTLPSIKRELEAGWKPFDDIWAGFDDQHWRREFGKTWTYAEQPWHMAYFDGTMANYVALRPARRDDGSGSRPPRVDAAHLRLDHGARGLRGDHRAQRRRVLEALAAHGKNSVPRRADLQITMKPENFHKLVSKMIPPPLLMLTGQMKIKGFGAMGTFAKLFPEPKPDQRIDPSAL